MFYIYNVFTYDIFSFQGTKDTRSLKTIIVKPYVRSSKNLFTYVIGHDNNIYIYRNKGFEVSIIYKRIYIK